MSKINISPENNLEIQISTGRSRRETQWKNVEMLWGDFVKRVSVTHRTAETYAEYLTLPKSRQDEIKDVGGFVGGEISGGRRKNQNILSRSLLTLDIDNAVSMDGWDGYKLQFGAAAVLYTTHKHCPEKPRYRLIILLDRPVFSDEYTAIGRYIANSININQFDPTTFEPARLMFWPSTASNGEFIFDYIDGKPLKTDEILNSRYNNWKNIGEWAYGEKHEDAIRKNIKKQSSPVEKPGIIGAFCRTYDIHKAIETFLSEEYTRSKDPNRYTYTRGSTSCGLVVYDNVFAYSHHGTDPAGGELCNAFDLVRLHKFGARDEDAKADTPSHKLPSYAAMLDFAGADPSTRQQAALDKIASAQDDFEDCENYDGADLEEEKIAWLKKLTRDRKNKIIGTIDNALLILENDSLLKEKLWFDEFAHREAATGDLPWIKTFGKAKRYLSDSDDAGIRHYLEKRYGFSFKTKIEDALKILMLRKSYHPVKKYLEGLIWDGKARVESLFIEYLGARDGAYVRACSRTALVAAVARIYSPGVKFDHVLTLVGGQGIGKSTVIRKLGGEWYSDSLETLQGKEAYEQLQGIWITELGELSSLKRTELEAVKHFITKQQDRFRVAYGRRVEDFPRQCVFFGTTNKKDFLRDETGNRRWWPIDCVNPPLKTLDMLTEQEVNQIWAEAVWLYKQGHKLYLPPETTEVAAEVQEAHLEQDESVGLIAEYLEKPLPSNWYSLENSVRRSYIIGDTEWCEKKLSEDRILRDKVCVQEIWCELYQGDLKTLDPQKARIIRNALVKIDGWEAHDLSKDKGRLKFGFYGRQKAFVRK